MRVGQEATNTLRAHVILIFQGFLTSCSIFQGIRVTEEKIVVFYELYDAICFDSWRKIVSLQGRCVIVGFDSIFYLWRISFI